MPEAARRGSAQAWHVKTWWIDDLGRWNAIDPDSPRMVERGDVPETAACNELMYRFFGMMRVDSDCQGMRLCWDVKHAHPAVLDTASQFLQDLHASVRLRFYFGGWNEEHYGHAAEARARLEQTRAFAAATPMVRTMIHSRPLAEVYGRKDVFGMVMRAFKEADGVLSAQLLRHLTATRLIDKLVLFENCPDTGRLIYRHVGRSSTLTHLFGLEWATQAPGMPYDHDPSVLSVTKEPRALYTEVLDLGAPRYDHLRTLVAIEQEEQQWVPYQRLLYPYCLSDGRKGLALLSKMTQSIAIPFMGRCQA